jgi:hypothetical protein
VEDAQVKETCIRVSVLRNYGDYNVKVQVSHFIVDVIVLMRGIEQLIKPK